MIKFYFILISIAYSTLTISEINISKYAEKSKYGEFKISPSGKYLALSIFSNNESRLLILDTDTKEAISEIFFRGKDEVGEIFWANDQRVIMKIFSKKKFIERPVYYGELFSFDIIKNRGKMIFGFRMSIGSRRSVIDKRVKKMHLKIPNSWASIIDILPNDEDHILIKAKPYRGDLLSQVYKLNIINGSFIHISEAPLPDSWFFTDDKGVLFLAIGVNDKAELVVFEKTSNKNKWIKVQSFKYSDSFQPISYNNKTKSLIFLDSHDTNTRSLFRLNIETSKKQVLFNDPSNDISTVELSDNRQYIYGIMTEPGYPKYHFPNLNVKHQDIFKSLTEIFNGYKITITSTTKNLNKLVFFVSSDREAGAWYLFDRTTKKVKFIAKKNHLINADNMLPMQAFKFNSRDGVKLSSYLTLPNTDNNELLPVVVLVHGGPFGVRDRWQYNSDVQLLAEAGYAVLQVNYRGSGGFGDDFKRLGFGHWGDDIQYDIFDGIQYLINQKFIDPNRICIMGSSFGGYTAVQLSILKPHLFRCAISAFGVYDLELLYLEGDTIESNWGESFWKKTIGNDKKKLKQFSPINHIDRIQTPLLLVHSEKDQRATIQQTDNLIAKLEEHNKVFDKLIFDYEAHGIYNETNRLEYYKKILIFLEKYNPIK